MLYDHFKSAVWIHQFENNEEFNQDVLNTAKAIAAITPEPVADHNVDLWVSDNMRKVRSYFKMGFDALCNVYDERTNYDIDNLNIINPMNYGDFKSCHTHDVIDAFGVYYLNEPGNGGNLRLYDPRFLNKKSFNSDPYIEVQPSTGLLVVAPYYIWHEVTPYLGQETRISLVCNMVFNNVDRQIK